ncbi:MAG: pectinesterase family protein [Chitinophagaceae bacterium]
MKKIFFLFITILFLIVSANAQYNKVVAKDGSGDFTTLQAAIDAAPTNSVAAWVIFIKNGKYYEKINIPSNKPNIQLIGETVSSVVVYYDDYAGKATVGGGTLGTQNSASVTINANDFVAVNITFANTFNYDSATAAGVTGTQAVAVVVNADRSAFKNCRFIGMQDTLYTKGSGTPRHYFYKCYIDGIVDFIFGSSIAIFDSCTIYPKARTGTSNSYITAANTTVGQAYGYLFRDCKIPANTGATLYFLGRPWGNSNSSVTSNSKTVFFNTAMSSSVNTLGWSVWDATTVTNVITYGEYQSKKMDGSLLDISNRVAWSKQFNTTDTIGYNTLNMFSGWNPCSVRTDFCASPIIELAISNFKGTKSGANTNFTWNASWALSGVTYDLYRSTDNKASFQLLSTLTSTNDTSINFSVSDVVPPACTSYFYFVKASNAGFATSFTDTIEISSIPTINATSGALINFLQGSTAPSAAQSVIVNGINLLGNVTITAPANYEISTDNSIWNINPIVLNQSSGSIANTILYVRLNSNIVGAYADTIKLITNCSSASIKKFILVSGIVQSTPLVNYDVIQQWDLTANNLDNAAIRAIGLTATIPTLSRLTLSNGTEVPAVPAYSTLYGQAIAPSATGNGMWTTASGGSGGSLNRTLYEQFTIKPDVNYNVRVDSFVASIGYYASVSGTRIAVAYSKSNFTSDSANVTGGRDLSGLTLPGTGNGAFTTPIVVAATSNSGNTSQYAFALNAGNGVQVNTGETLTIRVYFSCGSTSAGRYAVVKNVQAKGLLPINLPLNFVNYSIKQNDDKTIENIWLTANEINVSHFNIQRSINGKDFETIGKVDAKNTSENKYRFIDNKLPITTNNLTLFYRLESVDRDGKISYSEVKNVELAIRNIGVNIYPNPAKDVLNVICTNAKQLLIVDVYGKQVLKHTINNQRSIVNIQGLGKGVYIIQVIITKGEVINQKLVIE